ncbi:MAG: DUF1669 domain-containing protein [Bacteroidetes bacterium]|nr:DUF1669 domain-containing protein [Bacteroidota bacterium]
MIDKLESRFRQTLEDQMITKAERQAIARELRETPVPDRKLAVLRARIFDMAREQMQMGNSFVLDWLETVNKLILPGQKSEPETEVHFSPGESCRSTIINYIKQATRSIDICVFTISDDEISQEILGRKRRVKIRVLTDNDKYWDKGSDIEKFTKAGIEVKVDRTESHMHHKFAIYDRKYVLTGSYNWTRSAATSNQENILVTSDQEVVKKYMSEFDRLWRNMELL